MWALWDGRASEGAAGRAGLAALGAWGGALAVGALLALCGAARGSASLLAGAFALLALSAVAEGAAAWWGAAHLPQLRRALRDRLEHVVRHDYGVVHTRTHMLDAIQQGVSIVHFTNYSNSFLLLIQCVGTILPVVGYRFEVNRKLLCMMLALQSSFVDGFYDKVLMQ